MGLWCFVHLVDSELTQGGFWETVLRAFLGFGPYGSLRKQRQLGNPQGDEEIPSSRRILQELPVR